MSLRITSITTDDKGVYECIASNKFYNDSTLFSFTVVCMLIILNVFILNLVMERFMFKCV